MELFGGNELEQTAMEIAGCLNYSSSPWESEKADVYERQIYFRSKQISHYRGEVTSTQQKSRLSENDGWVVEEVMTFHGIPLSDYFNVRNANRSKSSLNYRKVLYPFLVCFSHFVFLLNLWPFIVLSTFQVRLKYHIEDDPKGMGCNVQAYLGIAWLKCTKQKKRFTKNIFSNMQERLKVMFSIVEKEYASAK